MSIATYDLTITEAAFRQIMDELLAHPNRIISCCVGLSRFPNRTEFLVHNICRRPAHDSATLLIAGSNNPARLATVCLDTLSRGQSESTTLCLAIGVEDALGNIAGVCQTTDGIKPLHTITIVCAGLPCIHLHQEASNTKVQHASHIAHHEVWSRTIGALTEAVWQRLVSLRIGVVGCGRTGSLVATSLARFGVQHLTLIDPDKLEPHNIGEMNGVALDDIGCTKVNALIKSLPAHSLADCLADSVLSLSALIAVKECDVIFCCVDSPSARLAIAFLTALYLKPLIDIGTGIFYTTPTDPITNEPVRQMGADIRLVLPSRCLLCFGGIAGLEQAKSELLNSQHLFHSLNADWQQQRAGSLRSLNTTAVGFALRLFEDFIGRHIRESTWLHLEIDNSGIPTLEHRTPPANPCCPLCALTGQGDDGLRELQTMLKNL